MKSNTVIFGLIAVIFLISLNGCEKKKEETYGSLTGIWDMSVSNGYTAAILLKQKGDDLYGTLREYGSKKVKFVVSGEISGNEITLKLSNPESNERGEIKATLSEGKIKGSWIYDDKTETMEAWKSWDPAKK